MKTNVFTNAEGYKYQSHDIFVWGEDKYIVLGVDKKGRTRAGVAVQTPEGYYHLTKFPYISGFQKSLKFTKLLCQTDPVIIEGKYVYINCSQVYKAKES